MAEIYASLDWYNRGQHHSTPQWSEERDAGRMRLDRVEGGDSRRTGPSRTTNQDVPLEAKVSLVRWVTPWWVILSHRFTLFL